MSAASLFRQVVLFVWVRNVIGYTSTTDPPEWMTVDGEYLRYSGQIGWELARVAAQMLFFGLLFGVFFGWSTSPLFDKVHEAKPLASVGGGPG